MPETGTNITMPAFDPVPFNDRRKRLPLAESAIMRDSPARGGGYHLDVILWLQSFSTPALDRFFSAVTRLGSEEFYLLFIPVVYWCVDRLAGARLSLLFLGSLWLNFAIKDTLQFPRPAGPGLRVVEGAGGDGYGFPSGHAQGNATVWTSLYLSRPGRVTLILGLAAVILVSLSRLYLGVHHPADVLGGIALGLLLTLTFHGLGAIAAAGRWTPAALSLMGAGAPLAMLLLYHSNDTYRMAGMFLGLAEGFLLERAWVGFATAEASASRQVVKAALGLGGLFALRLATSPFFPEGAAQVARYALMGLWIALGAPLLFRLLGLSVHSGRRGGARRRGSDRPVSGFGVTLR